MDHPLNLQARDENASKEGTLVGLPSEMNLNHFLVWDHFETRRTTVRFLSDICCFFGSTSASLMLSRKFETSPHQA